jgi:hypothetical protein
MQVLVKLNEPLGADLGPFNITANVGVVNPSTASREDLISGVIAIVDDNATQITITSNNSTSCAGTSLTLNISGLPEEECDCEYYDITVFETDVLDATGNTGPLEQYNNLVVYRFTNCDNVIQEVVAETGTYINALCVKDGTTVSITYYKNNEELSAISSANGNGTPCCSE